MPHSKNETSIMLPADRQVPYCLCGDLKGYEAGERAAVQPLVLHIWSPPSACPGQQELAQRAVSGVLSGITEGYTACAGGSNTEQALDQLKVATGACYAACCDCFSSDMTPRLHRSCQHTYCLRPRRRCPRIVSAHRRIVLALLA